MSIGATTHREPRRCDVCKERARTLADVELIFTPITAEICEDCLVTALRELRSEKEASG